MTVLVNLHRVRVSSLDQDQFYGFLDGANRRSQGLYEKGRKNLDGGQTDDKRGSIGCGKVMIVADLGSCAGTLDDGLRTPTFYESLVTVVAVIRALPHCRREAAA